jgi:ribose transport system permease protein
MQHTNIKLSRFLSDYGMVFALLLLCVLFSWLTWEKQYPEGATAGKLVAERIARDHEKSADVLIVGRDHEEGRAFAAELNTRLEKSGHTVVDTVLGSPVDARSAMTRLADAGIVPDVIGSSSAASGWGVFDGLGEKIPAFAETKLVAPETYYWPNFLKTENLLNVANQIVVIAIIAIGMTMVIITAGIDLSVGSLIALSSVVATVLIRNVAGAEQAGPMGMVLCCLAGIAVCAGLGCFSGTMTTVFGIPPFIVTLAMMLVGSGLAYILAQGHSIYQVPATFIFLGRGTFMGIPNSVVVMILLYIVAHIVMSRMALGRYIYAVGGNREAARLSGVPVNRILLLVYTVCGALAGLGGIVTASQLKSGSPTYGLMYELYVIAAVVVGGTSLSGGEGRIFGTLIGAFIIAVIQNGMNLTGVESYTQKVVLGLVILGAVLLDMMKKKGFFSLPKRGVV